MTEQQQDETSIMERWYQINASKSITPMVAETLDLPPSCVEFVPWDRNTDKPVDDHWFVVGTYNLERDPEDEGHDIQDSVNVQNEEGGSQGGAVDVENEAEESNVPPKKLQSRNGSLNLFRITGNKLFLVQTLTYHSAILDLHFFPNLPIFAVVASTGCISIYKLSRDHRIEHIATHQVFPPDVLILSFAWYPYGTPKEKSDPLLTALTLSTGFVHVIRFTDWDFTEFEILNDSEPLISHMLEAWCCAFSTPSYDDDIKIYSGGDDAKIRMISLEPMSIIKSDSHIQLFHGEPSAVYSGHGAGVTAILPLPGPYPDCAAILLTGSYDDHVRVYTTSPKAKCLTELYIGGGVWRLKLIQECRASPSDSPDRVFKYRVLASCMHAGARVLEIERRAEDWTIRVLGEVKIHKSMCYGSDVQPIDTDEEDGHIEPRVCVSTSFYDKLLCVWTFDPRKAV